MGSKGTLRPLLQSWLRCVDRYERLEFCCKCLITKRLVTSVHFVRLRRRFRGSFISLGLLVIIGLLRSFRLSRITDSITYKEQWRVKRMTFFCFQSNSVCLSISHMLSINVFIRNDPLAICIGFVVDTQHQLFRAFCLCWGTFMYARSQALLS